MGESIRKRKRRRWIIAAGSVILLVAFIAYVQSATFHGRVASLKLGQTEREVIQTMGAPDYRFGTLPVGALPVVATWHLYLSPIQKLERNGHGYWY
jgi:hypothetical protein